MGMFLNYQDIANNYIPNNLISEFNTPKSYTKLDSNLASKPYECYNAKGELEGYFWMYGNTLNLEFNIDGEITVETDAVLYRSAGLCPKENTVGKIGQRIYNIVDIRSWTCKAFEDNSFVWEEDTEFIYPAGTDRSVYVSAEDYLKDKQLIFRIYNFRMEEIHRKNFDGKSKIIIPIDPELSRQLVRGIYYCSLTAVSDRTCETIFGPQDCKLLVK